MCDGGYCFIFADGFEYTDGNKVEEGLGYNIVEEPYSYTEDGKEDQGGQGNGSSLLTLAQSSKEDISLHSSVLIETFLWIHQELANSSIPLGSSLGFQI